MYKKNQDNTFKKMPAFFGKPAVQLIKYANIRGVRGSFIRSCVISVIKQRALIFLTFENDMLLYVSICYQIVVRSRGVFRTQSKNLRGSFSVKIANGLSC